MGNNGNGMLSPYRVLDLTDEKGLICGKLLSDMGADVIKIEKPGGDPARNIGPFYHDEVDPEKSLFWFSFNTNKRGITLNIETPDGREIFKKLAKTADFVIESYPVGYLDKLGIGYKVLEKLNPGVIMVSITPFGQTGPYKDYKAPDIVAWALSGHMYATGDPDRPPLQCSHHSQPYLSAGSMAAAAALMALYQRNLTGEGQQVDISIQESLAPYSWATVSRWDMEKSFNPRSGPGGAPSWRFKCKDGSVLYMITGVKHNPDLVKWMDSEGMAPDIIKQVNWETFNDPSKPRTPEESARLLEVIGDFFKTHTKAELYQYGMKIGVTIFPMSTIKDMVNDVQLDARNFWADIDHPELNTTIRYPGAFAQTSELPPRVSRPAPLIGEHNDDIYNGEFGLTKPELSRLKKSGVI